MPSIPNQIRSEFAHPDLSGKAWLVSRAHFHHDYACALETCVRSRIIRAFESHLRNAWQHSILQVLTNSMEGHQEYASLAIQTCHHDLTVSRDLMILECDVGISANCFKGRKHEDEVFREEIKGVLIILLPVFSSLLKSLYVEVCRTGHSIEPPFAESR